MFRYKIDVMKELIAAGYNPARIRKEKLLGERTIQQIREGEVVGITSLERICMMLHCQPGDLIEWAPDNE